jgi:hypothetical protein
MAGQDELAQLEAERDRLLSMIAYHNGPFYRRQPGSRAEAWFPVIAVAGISGIVVTIEAAVFAGQISASIILFLVVVVPPLAYILTRRLTVVGTTLSMGEILPLFLGVVTPVGQPAGEPQARQRLAECEARIMELKESRP